MQCRPDSGGVQSRCRWTRWPQNGPRRGRLPWDLCRGCVMALQRGLGAGAVDMAVAESGNTHSRRRGIGHCPVLMNKSWGRGPQTGPPFVPQPPPDPCRPLDRAPPDAGASGKHGPRHWHRSASSHHCTAAANAFPRGCAVLREARRNQGDLAHRAPGTSSTQSGRGDPHLVVLQRPHQHRLATQRRSQEAPRHVLRRGAHGGIRMTAGVTSTRENAPHYTKNGTMHRAAAGGTNLPCSCGGIHLDVVELGAPAHTLLTFSSA